MWNSPELNRQFTISLPIVFTIPNLFSQLNAMVIRSELSAQIRRAVRWKITAISNWLTAMPLRQKDKKHEFCSDQHSYPDQTFIRYDWVRAKHCQTIFSAGRRQTNCAADRWFREGEEVRLQHLTARPVILKSARQPATQRPEISRWRCRPHYWQFMGIAQITGQNNPGYSSSVNIAIRAGNKVFWHTFSDWPLSGNKYKRSFCRRWWSR